ncbi:MAG: molybdenum ABC transporter permease, partial [Planctomyces sp.]
MSASGDQQQAVLNGRRGPLRDAVFFLVMGGLSSCFVLLIVLLLAADLSFTSPRAFAAALQKPEIQAAFRLTMLTCTLAAVLSVWVATPLGYLLSRFRFPGSRIVDVLVDIPIVLPPLVLGLSLLILFHQPFPLTRWFAESGADTVADGGKVDATGRPAGWILEKWLEESAGIPVTYRWPAVVLAQFAVSCAFAVRTMRVTFDQINPRAEDV